MKLSELLAFSVIATAPLANAAGTSPEHAPAIKQASEDFLDFGSYAPILQAVAADPARKAELAFLRDCKSRMLGISDRAPSVTALAHRFVKEFPGDSAHPATRLALAGIMVAHADRLPNRCATEFALEPDYYQMNPFEFATIKRLNESLATCPFKEPALVAHWMILKIRCNGSFIHGKKGNSAMRSELFKHLKKNQNEPWLINNQDLEIAIYHMFRDARRDDITPPELNQKRDFKKWLESIKPENRTFAQNLELGSMHMTEAMLKHQLFGLKNKDGKWIQTLHVGVKKTENCTQEFLDSIKTGSIHLKMANAQSPNNLELICQMIRLATFDEKLADAPPEAWLELAKKHHPSSAYPHLVYARRQDVIQVQNKQINAIGTTRESILSSYEAARNNQNFDSPVAGISGQIFKNALGSFSSAERKDMLCRRASDFIAIANGYIRRFNETGAPLVSSPRDVEPWLPFTHNGAAGPAGSISGCIDYRALALSYLAESGMMNRAGEVLAYTRPGFPPDSADSLSHYFFTGYVDKNLHGGLPRLLAELETGDRSTLLMTYPGKKSVFDKSGRIIYDPNDTQGSLKAHSSIDWLTEYNKRLRDMEKKAKTPTTKNFLKNIINSSELAIKFANGESIVIPAHRDYWMPIKGYCEFKNDSILFPDIPRYKYAIASINLFKPPYELSITINAKPYLPSALYGITIGEDNSGRGFFYESGSGAVKIIPTPTGTPTPASTTRLASLSKNINLSLRVFNYGYSVRLNDGPWQSLRDIGFTPGRIYLNNNNPTQSGSGRGEFEYSNLAIRKLKESDLTEEEAKCMSATEEEKKAAIEAEKKAQLSKGFFDAIPEQYRPKKAK